MKIATRKGICLPDSEKVWRLGILISGRGSNMVALADAVRAGRVPGAEVVLVISDQAKAGGLARAKERGLETLVFERRGRSREEHDRERVDPESQALAGDATVVVIAGADRTQ